MKRLLVIIFFLRILPMMCSSLLILDEHEMGVVEEVIEEREIDFPWAESEGMRNVLRRASQLATIEWQPIHDVPWNRGVFPAGSYQVGIPYSSTKQINKYVGMDVSFHTFMTAVHNPYSVLYTENISQPPYSGVNCATYYGDVCSTCVEYALGIDKPYPANILVTLPEFELLEDQSITNFKPGDLLHSPGHVFMVFRLNKDQEGQVTSVTLFESASQICRIYDTTVEKLESRIVKDKIQAYRYKLIDKLNDYTPSVYVNVGSEPKTEPKYNEALCPARGDECVFRTDESVVINVFDSSCSELYVEKENGEKVLYQAREAVDLGCMDVGMYKAYVRTEKGVSEPVKFVVAKPEVSVTGYDIHHVTFSCEYGQANYCVLCIANGDFLKVVPIDDVSREQGSIDIDRVPNRSNYFCKVVFDTPYGTVINQPIPVK